MSGADRSASARPLDRPVHASLRPASSSRPAGQHVQPSSSSAAATTSSADSWVEVSSRASSSSLSSVTGDDIVTTGLRIQNAPPAQRRRRTILSGAPLRLYVAAARREAGGSSQDEYEESGSESDRILTSSNEGLSGPASEAHSISNRAPASATSADTEDDSNLDDDDDDGNEDEDEDESATALGVNNQACFTPQPNAFSHPPSSSSYFTSTPAARSQPRSRHPSFTARTVRQSHSPLSSSHHADHDAALRASLSTLLSCAAAARGLPKSQQSAQRQPQPTNRVEPHTLRMVPESALKSASPRPRSSSSSSLSRSADRKDSSRRKSASRSSSKERALAAKRAQADLDIAGVSPTLLTWVVSAGVLVLVSALSFGAGYSTGREAGRVEAGFLDPTPTVAEGCGRGAVLRGSSGLRRLRWTDAASAVVAGA